MFHPDALRDIPFPPEAAGGCGFAFRCDGEHPISFGRSGEFRRLIGTQGGVLTFHYNAQGGIPFPPEAGRGSDPSHRCGEEHRISLRRGQEF
jgi:hypothetical protein